MSLKQRFSEAYAKREVAAVAAPDAAPSAEERRVVESRKKMRVEHMTSAQRTEIEETRRVMELKKQQKPMSRAEAAKWRGAGAGAGAGVVAEAEGTTPVRPESYALAPRTVHYARWSDEAMSLGAVLLPPGGRRDDELLLLVQNHRPRTMVADRTDAGIPYGPIEEEDYETYFIMPGEEPEWTAKRHWMLVLGDDIYFVPRCFGDAACQQSPAQRMAQKIASNDDWWQAAIRADRVWRYGEEVAQPVYRFDWHMDVFDIENPYDANPKLDIPNAITWSTRNQPPRSCLHNADFPAYVFENSSAKYVEMVATQFADGTGGSIIARYVPEDTQGEDVFYLQADDTVFFRHDAIPIIKANPRLWTPGDFKAFEFDSYLGEHCLAERKAEDAERTARNAAAAAADSSSSGVVLEISEEGDAVPVVLAFQ